MNRILEAPPQHLDYADPNDDQDTDQDTDQKDSDRNSDQWVLVELWTTQIIPQTDQPIPRPAREDTSAARFTGVIDRR
jgi:hypothetical protein